MSKLSSMPYKSLLKRNLHTLEEVIEEPRTEALRHA